LFTFRLLSAYPSGTSIFTVSPRDRLITSAPCFMATSPILVSGNITSAVYMQESASPRETATFMPLRSFTIDATTAVLVKLPGFPGTPPHTLGFMKTLWPSFTYRFKPPSSSTASLTIASGSFPLTIETRDKLLELTSFQIFFIFWGFLSSRPSSRSCSRGKQGTQNRQTVRSQRTTRHVARSGFETLGPASNSATRISKTGC